MAEVTSAVIATSLVLISVFVPVTFFPGTTGILYKQFSLTIAFSIAISAFNALTLSPALARILLRRGQAHGLIGLILNPFERAACQCGHSWLRASSPSGCISLRYVMSWLSSSPRSPPLSTSTPMCPRPSFRQEDQNYFLIMVQAPPGASLAYTTEFADRGADLVRKDPDVFGTFSVMGFSLPAAARRTPASSSLRCKPIDERTQRATATLRGNRRPHRPQALRHTRRHSVRRRTACHPRHRHLRRLPVQAAGLGPQHLRGPRPHRPQHRRAVAQPGLRPERALHQLYRQRSAAAGHHRP